MPRAMAHSIPPTELLSRDAIRFLHPGYSINNTLLSLPRVDRVENTTTFGVHHRTALLACQIIAGNAFDTSHLTLDKEGQQPVNLLLDDILTEKEYYLIVDDHPGLYPITPSFQDWKFPHDRIPDSWPRVSASTQLSQFSASTQLHRCGISNFSFAIEEAHLIPQEEEVWYQRNDMRRYGRELLRNINDSANILPLKSDLHKCFDKRWFIIVPKSIETTAPSSSQYVTHILLDEAAELWPTYHNTVVQYLDEKARCYLFARFAWAILLLVKPFILAGFPRYVIRFCMSGDDEINHEVKFLDGSQLKTHYGGGGSMRATPLNKRSATGSMRDDGDLRESSSEDGDLDMENDWEDTVGEWRQKVEVGRRQISSETAVEEDNQAHVLAELKARLEEVLPGGGDDIPQQG